MDLNASNAEILGWLTRNKNARRKWIVKGNYTNNVIKLNKHGLLLKQIKQNASASTTDKTDSNSNNDGDMPAAGDMDKYVSLFPEDFGLEDATTAIIQKSSRSQDIADGMLILEQKQVCY